MPPPDPRDPTRLKRTPSQKSRVNTTLEPQPDSSYNERIGTTPLAGNPNATSPLAQSFDTMSRPSRAALRDDYSDYSEVANSTGLQRSPSTASIGRSNTLRKQKSLSRKSSMKRSSSRSARAGSIGGIMYDDTSGIDTKSVYYTPIPTSGSPVEILAARFQAWRRFLKELIGYFREVQGTYEVRAKQLSKVSHTIANINLPQSFLNQGGLGDALNILRNHHKEAYAETNKAREIEQDVINQLTVLKSDLGQKIKEIKSLSGDFKNVIEKEKDNTKKLVDILQESIAVVDTNSKVMVGKDDPFIVKLAVERQVERQIDEENFLHRAYLNLEGSGRELDAIVVGEIQKALNAFATILKKEADDSYDTAEKLRKGPITIPKDLEWSDFILKDPHFVSPDTPLRRAQDLEYPGKHHPAAAEVRAGMLERKSKYLKSYTPGWFVLSPTHIHEFKSADGVYTQAPIMSLFLQDQKLGSHSQPSSSSHKFMLKGRQAGSMHRGHSWVFRAETYDTMLAWYDDIKNLTEKTGEERNRFIRGHSRSISARSIASTSSFEDDEADRIPYSLEAAAIHGTASTNGSIAKDSADQKRPQPGGRFPSDIVVGNRDLPSRLSESSSASGDMVNVPNGVNTIAGRDGNGSVTSQRSTAQSTPYDQKSLKEFEAGMLMAQHPAFRGTNTSPSLRNTELQKERNTSPSQKFSPQRSTGATKTETSSPARMFAASLHNDRPETPLDPAPREPDKYRVHQSPERPVVASTQAGTYAFFTAPIESYSPSIDARSGPAELGATPSVVNQPESNTPQKIVAEATEFESAPVLTRKNTDASLSHFHVPGEFPIETPGSTGK